jgi:hypothetical protein
MLLNKIPVLDKGFVALIDSCNTTQKLRDIDQEFFFGKYPTVLEDLGSLTVVMKCPLFVQLDLSKFAFKIINTENADVESEAYIPSAAQLGGSDVVTAQPISNDISRTTAALLINPRAYQADGADAFVSQVLTPINIYTTLIIQGSYKEWCSYAYTRKVPGPIKAYTMALQQIIDTEWK